MKNKLLKKMLAILIIMMIVATDFFVLGSNLISYAVSNGETNNENIEFSAYFKDEEGNKVDHVLESIKKTDLKMYAEIKVKNEGYFNGSIELQDANFKIKNNILSSNISSIEGNKINLKQINAGSTVEIELDIEPIIEDTIKSDLMSMESTVKITGQYMEETYKGLDIQGTKKIKLEFMADETAKPELETEIITNDVMKIDGNNKRIVQLLVKSRLSENQFPITQTTINVDIPKLSSKLPEDVKVLALSTKATNGQDSHVIEEFTNENGKLQIILKNEPNEDNKITWNKDVYDELIITLLYNEDVDASTVKFNTNTELMLYGYTEPFTASSSRKIEGMTLNKTVSTNIQADTTEMYKGQLYVNAKSENIKDIEYKTTTVLEITNNQIIDEISIHEGPDVFKTTSDTEVAVNTKFIRTEINKEKMLEILGQDGSIYVNDGETIQTLTKDTEANDAGNIVLEYASQPNELTISTTKPEKAGLIEFNHTKAIIKNDYTVEQLKTINRIVSKNTVTGTLEENTVTENSTESSIELKETVTKAELTIDKENLSTMTSNNELTLGVKLITDGVQFDLYKNPTIQIQLPKAIGDVTVNSVNPLYADGFEINVQQDLENKILYIKLTGEQTDYPETQATQIYIQIKLSITIPTLTPSGTDNITLMYTNENATQYDGGRTDMGVVEKQVNIVSPTGLIPVNNIETYNIEAIGGISENKQLANIDKNTAGGTDIKYNIALLNNTKSDINNVRILGILPRSGEFTFGTETIKNNFDATLKSAITAENATVYYTNNINATADLDNTNNGWTQNLTEVTNPKAYLIVIPTIGQAVTFNATYTVTLPSVLDYDLTSYTGYTVTYNEGTDTVAQKTESLLVGITTGEGIKIETKITAAVGNEVINSGDTVKAGEVIRYTVTAKNNGTQTLKNVVLKGGVPEGTVYVEPDRGKTDITDDDIESDTGDDLGYVYSGTSYYKEYPDKKEISYSVEYLEPGKEYTFTYEVRVNMNITTGVQCSNNAEAIYQNFTIKSEEFKTILEEASLRVTIKSIVDEEIPIIPGGSMQYFFFIENFSKQAINNLSIQIIPEGFNATQLKDKDLNLVLIEDINNIKIDEIPAEDVIYFYLPVDVNYNINKMLASLKVSDSEGNIYRSNLIEKDVESQGATVKLTSPNEGEFIEIGDEVIYNLSVENTSSYVTAVTIVDKIPEELEIIQISVDGKVTKQTTNVNDNETYVYSINNDLNYYLDFYNSQKAEVQITTKVRYTEEEFETKTIKNSAQVMIDYNLYDTSNEVSHILKGNTTSGGNPEDGIMINGTAWLDENQDGKKEAGEKLLSGIKVMLLDLSTNSIAKNTNGDIAETVTNSNGEYIFSKIKAGKYIVLFEFDRTQYRLTEYMIDGASDSQSSKVLLKSVEIDGKESIYAVTDTIDLTTSISNINIGLIEDLIFDLELDKYISKISVQNSKGTKTYEYTDSVFQKVEIHSKQINGSVVVLEYTIRVKNTGEISGNINSIVDYLDNGLEFSSELNPDWYLSGGNLYNNVLANNKIEPGETREVKLILTKKMTEDNVGLINNRAEICEYFNEFGKEDIDSTPNNLSKDEDDLGSADVIISISTGIRNIGYGLLILINIGLIIVAIYLIVKKNKRRF